MHKKIIVWSLAAGLFFGSVSPLSAQDADVFVDLSALDALGGTANPAVSSGPLFPVVKTQKPAAVKTVKKRRVKKAKSEPQAKVVVPAKEDIKVDVKLSQPQKTEAKAAEASEPAAPAPIVPVKAEVVTSEIVNPQPEPPQIPFVESSEPVKVVDVEPAPQAEKISAPAEEPSVPEVSAEPVVKDEPAAQDAPLAQNVSVAQDASGEKNVNPRLVFAAENAELSPEQERQIDAVISSFEDAAANKIAIYSYNLDDGVDAFRKKRTSLNRAVEVRSYLIRKGYKNFSIKVVNVEPGSEKINTVEIEELK